MGPRQPGIARHGPLHRERQAGQRQLVKNIAAVGRVHQQQADALVLLLGEFLRLQSPEVSQRKIAGRFKFVYWQQWQPCRRNSARPNARPKPVANSGAESTVPSV